MDKIIFVKPVGKGSPSIYSHELAKRLDKYPKIEIKQISTPLVSYREFFNFLKYIINNRDTTIHFPFYYYAKFAPLTRRSIVSVHDLWWIDYQIIDYLAIDPLKITVIYLGVDHTVFRPVNEPNPFNFDYILYVGSEQPRKNLKTLLKAFKILKKNPDFKNLKLVKVGGPETENFRRQTLEEITNQNLKNDVIFTGYVKEEILPIYYSNARCFVSPSLCEGFGLPTVEAMACGCPVIAANTSAFPEIIGDSGLMRDPLDAGGFARDIGTVLTDNRLRDAFIRKGIDRAKLFSWDNTVTEMIKVYDRIGVE
jgi:glycosyltransferase involved in cell wall biosynthesis